MAKDMCSACLTEGEADPQPARSRGFCPKHYQRAARAGAFREGAPEKPCPICIDEKLDDIQAIYTRGMCRRHYLRKRKSGELERVYKERGTDQLCTACLEVGEERAAHAKGLCGSHYGRAYRGVDTSTPIRKAPPPTCTFEGCDNDSSRGGLCAGHKSQEKRGKPLTPLRSYKARGGPCEAAGCTFTAANDGVCSTHYNRKVAGEPDWDRPIKAKAPNGTGSISDGYRIISVNGKSIGEHRHLMEQLLGRRLRGSETVHHLNGNRSDNRTDGPLRLVNGKLRSGNLELWSSAQPAGQEIGPKLDWALEMLQEYGDYLPETYRTRLAGVLERTS